MKVKVREEEIKAKENELLRASLKNWEWPGDEASHQCSSAVHLILI